ncbi:MAG TPA: 3-hydroxyacyl-CoA dehydrogenase NAD-binding domain-containing protein [Bacteroidota bacterium]
MKTIGIAGAGTMGSGIAQTAAMARFSVILTDTNPAALKGAMAKITGELDRLVEREVITERDAAATLRRIQPARTLRELADADLVIEAAVEDLAVKRTIIRTLDPIVSPHAVLASNTSSLSIGAIAAAVRNPETVVGMHFFNPAPVMKLVEIIRGPQTSDEAVKAVLEAAAAMGKTAVLCRDTPGFIVNRIARPFYGEALRLLGEGAGSVEAIDRIMKLEGGFRMGPFELMDLIGIDVNYAVTLSVYEQFFHEPRFRPHPLQRRMVEAGTLGRKTGRGFYQYS